MAVQDVSAEVANKITCPRSIFSSTTNGSPFAAAKTTRAVEFFGTCSLKYLKTGVVISAVSPRPRKA